MLFLAASRLVCAILTLTLGTLAASGNHPQDGPHADLRIAIEDQALRFSAGLNLAFVDHAIGVRREALDAVSDAEAQVIEQRLSERLLNDLVITLNGQPVQGRIESFSLWTDPDPSLTAFYPNTGMRALIRAVVVLSYRAESPLTEATMTWPTYPLDMITTEVTADDQRPTMYLEALLRAEGGVRLVRFSEPNPTVEWHPGDTNPETGFTDLPAPPTLLPPRTVSGLLLLGGLVAVAGLLVALLRVGPTVIVLITAAVVAGAISIASLAFPARFRVPMPLAAPQAAPIPDSERTEIFNALHNNLYQAFDYTAEGDVYDALTRSVAGPLLDEVYNEVFASLQQAEQGGEQGVVTGVENLGTALPAPADSALGLPAENADPRTFAVRHRWRVEGTVYHFGHSHSRTIEYDAAYRVSPTTQGWRITEQRIVDQRILGAPPPIQAGEI